MFILSNNYCNKGISRLVVCGPSDLVLWVPEYTTPPPG